MPLEEFEAKTDHTMATEFLQTQGRPTTLCGRQAGQDALVMCEVHFDTPSN